jgi:DNA repair protein SbcC/Rad50
MKEIKLKSLKLRNFKGVKESEFVFDKETNVHGMNGSGKTTVFDSYTWLLFGKNSQNQSVFGLKTNNEDGTPIHNLEHEVEGVFDIDNSEVVLKRTYKEKWTKKRGAETAELTGHETVFFVNDVPKSLSEYKTIVDSIISEDSQKILSNPLYFNVNMKWEDRRIVLSRLAGEVSDWDIMNSMDTKTITELEKLLATDKTLSDYKKEYASKRKKIKDELILIPSRIDEANRSLPEVKDWATIEKTISEKQTEVDNIDSKIEDSTKAMESQFAEINKVKQTKFQKEQELQTLKNNLISSSKKDLNDQTTLKNDLVHVIHLGKTDKKQIDEKIELLNKSIISTEKETADLRTKLSEENSKVFEIDPDKTKCNSCNRKYEENEVVSITENAEKIFNDNKTKVLDSIRATGKLNNEKVAKWKAEIEALETKKKSSTVEAKEAELKIVEEKIVELSKSNLVFDKTIPEAKLELEISEIIIPEAKPIDNSELKSNKEQIRSEIDELKTQLHTKLQIETISKRILELETQQKTMSQEIANLEKVELCIEQFDNLKIKTIEERVNSKFKLVKFKMFQQNLNGGSEMCCICTKNGVDFNDINTASKINCGIEVINILQQYYETCPPIFIDGRESISELINTNSQLINLVVDSSCETLTVK